MRALDHDGIFPAVTYGPDNEDSDLDRTDELPVLSEDAIVRMRSAELGEDVETTGEHTTTVLNSRLADDTVELEHPTTGPAPGSKVARLERDVADLNARWRAVEALLGESTSTLASLQTELAANRSALGRSREDEQKLERELTAQRTATEELRQQLARTEADLTAANRELEALRQSAAELEGKLGDAERKLAATATVQGRSRDRIEALEAELETAKSAQRTAADESAALKAALAAAAAEKNAALVTVAEVREQAAAHETTTVDQSLRNRLAELENYIAGRKDRWSEMEATVADRGERIRELEDELSYRVERQSELESELAAMRTSADAYHDEVERLRLLADADRAGGRETAGAMRPSGASDVSAVVELEHRLERARQLLGDLEGAFSAMDETGAAEPAGDEDRALSAADTAPDEPPLASPHAGTASATLIGLTSDTKPRHEIVKDLTTIGRGADCDVRIMTHFVSRLHAVLRRADGEFFLEDRDSMNGVFVNSVRVQKSALQDGDWITVGETQFRFVMQAPTG